MQTIAEVMTHEVVSVSPQDTVSRAAQFMDEMDVGSLPVCDGQRLIGMITDRDITIRAASTGQEPDDTRVEEIMTEDVLHCFDNQTVEEVLEDMGDIQIRRVPVLDHNTNALVGIISLGDLATRNAGDTEDTERTANTLKEVSTPDQGDRSRPH